MGTFISLCTWIAAAASGLPGAELSEDHAATANSVHEPSFLASGNNCGPSESSSLNHPSVDAGCGIQPCAPGMTPEGEPDCYDGYLDEYNPGCDFYPYSAPLGEPAMLPISCGETICGRTGYYLGKVRCLTDQDCASLHETCHTSGFCTGGPVPIRDADWYRIDLTDYTRLEFCASADFPLHFEVVNTLGGTLCPNGTISPTWIYPCGTCCEGYVVGPGSWYLFAHVAAGWTTVPCGSEYAISLECSFPCASCEVIGARSCMDHGGSRLCLDIRQDPVEAPAVEPRLGGVEELEVTYAARVPDYCFLQGTVVSCEDSSGTVTDESHRIAGTTILGETVTVSFNPPLPGPSTCTIQFDGGASVCVRNLEGDLNRDGAVTTADASIIKPHFNQSAATAGAALDFNRDGTVTPADFSQVKPLFNNTAPACP